MTVRPLTALAAGALLAGSLLATAGPASADPCYPPSPSCAVSSGVQMSTGYDAASGVAAITLTGLQPGSTVTVTVAAPSAAPAVYRPGRLHVLAASSTVAAGAVRAAAATTTTVSGVADSRGVAVLHVPVGALGASSPEQVARLVFEVQGTSATGTQVVVQTQAAQTSPDSGPTPVAAAQPTHRTSLMPYAGAAGVLVLLGGGAALAVSRRRDGDTGATGA